MPKWASQESKANRNKKKNITIEFDTWERLKSFGKMGDTFDDVLNRLMDTPAAQPEIQRLQQPPQQDKNIESVTVNPGVVSSRAVGSAIRTSDKRLREKSRQQGQVQEQEATVSTQNQKQALQQQQHKPEIVRLTGIGMNLPGISFPINKNEIIEYAEDNNPITTTDFLRELPDKTYYNIAELEKACLKIFRFEIETWNSRDKIFELHEFIIDTRDVQERRQPKRQLPDLLGRDNIVPLKNDELQINLTIPELTIPTTKDKLLKTLRKKREEINRETHKSVQESKKKILSIMDNNITIIENLPFENRTYNDVSQLEEEIVNLFRNEKIIERISLHRKELFNIPTRSIKPGAIVGCKILYRPDIFRNNMKLISDREKEDLDSLRKQFSKNDN